MASTLENALRLVKPGEMVVSLTDILDKLGNKITAEEKEQLLIAMLSPRREKIQPGDLITSDLINVVLADVADLQVKVAKLEAGAGIPSGQVVIFKPLPGDQFRSTYDMVIEGKNFDFSKGKSNIKIDTTPVTEYRAGSSDEKLIVGIPKMDVKVGGQSALLTVSNGVTSAERQITLLPAEDLSGHVIMTWVESKPATPVSGGELLLKVKAFAETNLDGKLLVSPVVSRVANAAEWNTQLEVLDSNKVTIGDRKVDIKAKQEAIFYIRLKKIPAVAGNATPTFAITVNISAGLVKDKAGPLLMKVGDIVELPDSNVTLSYVAHEFKPNQDAGLFTRGDEEDTITVKQNLSATITNYGIFTLTADITATGRYIFSPPEIISGADKWQVVRDPAQIFEYEIAATDLANTNKKARKLFYFRIAPGQGAADSGEIRLRVARDGGGGLSSSLLMLVRKG